MIAKPTAWQKKMDGGLSLGPFSFGHEWNERGSLILLSKSNHGTTTTSDPVKKCERQLFKEKTEGLEFDTL